MADKPPPPISPYDPSQVRGYLLDLAGIAFVAAAIYVGIFHGVADGAFPAFTALAGAYLGLKG